MFLILNFLLTTRVLNFFERNMQRNPQDLLYHSNLLVDIFGFLLLAMPQFRFNDASIEIGASEGIFSS